MKKGFISIFTLMILLVLSITITFLFVQNQNTADYNKDLYNKKQAQYLAESVLNKYLDENFDEMAELILEDYDKNKKTPRIKSQVISKSHKVTYLGKEFKIVITAIKRLANDDRDLDGLYQVYPYQVSVGESKAKSHIYFKVKETYEEDNKFDKNRLEIVIRQTY